VAELNTIDPQLQLKPAVLMLDLRHCMRGDKFMDCIVGGTF
jgi:hypothetical protein